VVLNRIFLISFTCDRVRHISLVQSLRVYLCLLILFDDDAYYPLFDIKKTTPIFEDRLIENTKAIGKTRYRHVFYYKSCLRADYLMRQ
jgi:hypothetical protein